jgi:nucleoside-diphosphate-sugar epimerase
MGAGDKENLFFFKIARAGWAVAFSGPPRPLSWIDVDDCARGFLLLAERPEARGEVFFLASPELTSAQGLQLAVAEALGTPVRRVTVPGFVLRSIAEVGELIRSISGRRFPLNRKLAAQALAPGWVCDPAKACDKLGFVAATPLAESVRRAVEGYRREGLL